MKKDELAAALAVAKNQITSMEKEDSERRMLFSDYLGHHYVKESRYGDDEKLPLPWERIYYYFGKLVQEKSDHITAGRIEAMAEQMNNIGRELYQMQKDNDNPDPCCPANVHC